MNEWLRKLLERIRELWKKWSLVQKIILIGIVLAVIAVLIFIFSFSSNPSTVHVYPRGTTDPNLLDRQVARLSELNIKFDIDNDTGLISVADEATARRARTELSVAGLEPGNTDPWDFLDMKSWTITDFERDINLKNTIKKELTKHIESLSDIDRADVAIDIPDTALFREDQTPVTASVVLFFKPGSSFGTDKQKIRGLQNLILKTISGLTAENLFIMDSAGTTLNNFDGMQELEAVDVYEREQRLIAKLEGQLRAKILTALQKYYTIDRVRDLNVKIEMDMSKKTIQATEITPIVMKADNPDTPYDDSVLLESVTISSQKVDKTWTGTGVDPEGPAGVEGQNPPVYSDMKNLIGTSEEHAETKNQEVNKREIQEEKRPTIDRLTVSVAIDGKWRKVRENGKYVIDEFGSIKREYIEIPKEQLEDTDRIVKDAVGYNKSRGDSVTVRNIPYDRDKEFQEEDAAFFRSEQTKRTIVYVLCGIAVVLLAFVIFRFVSRYLERKRRLREEEMLRKMQMEREKALWQAEQAGMEVTMSVEERRRAELQENAITMAKEHPEDVAQLIRTWLMEE